MNTTIFLELILVIVGETLEDEMGYDPTFTVPITRSSLEESWDYSSEICDVFPSVKLSPPDDEVGIEPTCTNSQLPSRIELHAWLHDFGSNEGPNG